MVTDESEGGGMTSMIVTIMIRMVVVRTKMKSKMILFDVKGK